MKKLLFLILLLIPLGSMGQAFITIYPPNAHVGAVIVEDNVYLRARIGTISKYENVDADYLKVSAGVRFQFSESTDMLIGTAYNNLTIYYEDNPQIDLDGIKAHSFELGFIKKVSDKVSVLALIDFTNWETDLGITYKF